VHVSSKRAPARNLPRTGAEVPRFAVYSSK
jgi:hypothetical protein